MEEASWIDAWKRREMMCMTLRKLDTVVEQVSVYVVFFVQIRGVMVVEKFEKYF